ncbi:hypothetical protein QL285_050172 [Trifolium repens]|nr:hypothetical protein QL285_050172 [Trifolium repens]
MENYGITPDDIRKLQVYPPNPFPLTRTSFTLLLSSLPLCNAIKRRRDAPFPPIPVTGGDGESPAASASPRRFSVFGKVWGQNKQSCLIEPDP